MRRLLVLLLLVGCTATQTTSPSATPAHTPPPPMRPENGASAGGVITDGGGRPVARAQIRAWAADAACSPTGHPESTYSGEDGRYQVRVAAGVGPQFDACIVLEATAGGASARVQRPVHYAPDAAAEPASRIDITLPPATLLTRAEADRLLGIFRAAFHGTHEAVLELGPYLGTTPDLTPQRLEPFQRSLRGVTDEARLVTEGDRRFEYELTGRRPGTSMRVVIWQDALTHMELR